MEFSRPEYWSGLPCPSPGDLPNPGIKPRSPTLQADSLPAEPQRKPKNTEVGSLSLLHRTFMTQGLNWGLLHCRWILYQLSHIAIREAQLPIILWACLSYPHLSAITQIIVNASWNRFNNSNKDGLLGSYYFPGISRHELIPTLKASFREMHQCLWISEEIEAQRS